MTLARIFVDAAALVLLVPLAGVCFQMIAGWRDRRRMTLRGRLASVDGKRMFYCDPGAGACTVVFESGMIVSNLHWWDVQKAVAERARTFSYDRLGLGWSDPCTSERTPLQLATELHRLLQAAGVPPPYVLVSHSYGVMIQRVFALEYPEEVAGMVLIDPLRTEGWLPDSPAGQALLRGGSKLMQRAVVPTWLGLTRFAAQGLLYRSASMDLLMSKLLGKAGKRHADRMTRELEKMPREVQPEIVSQWSLPAFYAGCAIYIRGMADCVRCMLEVPAVEGVPVLVIRSAGSPLTTPGYEHARGSCVDEIVVENSTHWVHLDQPAIVVEAICNVVERVTQVERATQMEQPVLVRVRA